MANVDPFVRDWPRKWLEDPEIGPIIIYLNRFLHDIFIRTGGGNDAIQDEGIRELYPWGTSTQERTEFRAVTIGTRYTAAPFDFINAITRALIFFPEFPNENDVIVIRNGDGSLISLDGNGKNINGSRTGRLLTEERTVDFYYFIDSDEWFAK